MEEVIVLERAPSRAEFEPTLLNASICTMVRVEVVPDVNWAVVAKGTKIVVVTKGRMHDKAPTEVLLNNLGISKDVEFPTR